MIKVILIAHNQIEFVQMSIDILKLYSGIEKEDIVIVDNASTDGLKEWLEQQKELNYMCCNEVEGYGKILNTAIKEFAQNSDVLLLNPCYMPLPHCLEHMEQMLHADASTGAVGFKLIWNEPEKNIDFQKALEMAENNQGNFYPERKLFLKERTVLIKKELILELQKFDESLKLPRYLMRDYLLSANNLDYVFYHCQNAFAFSLSAGQDIYAQTYGEEEDRNRLKEKWQVNYLVGNYNGELLSMIAEDRKSEIKVLEVGCDCGGNLMQIQNRYPKAKCYGLEINTASVEIARHIAEVEVGDIEDCAIPFEEKKFDYILFGDVLEHLKEPARVLLYCRELLTENGRILACIPNIMHISVIRELLNGNFEYSDMGLLDKTHIHFFTYKEIIRMFETCEYKLEKIKGLTFTNGDSEKNNDLIKKILELTDGSQEFMFQAYQYFVSARPIAMKGSSIWKG